MSLLPLIKPAERMRADIATKVVRPAKSTVAAPARSASSARPAATSIPDSFDVAISFAGTERESASKLAEILRDAGYAVFYDNFFPGAAVGKEPRDIL